MTEPDAYYTYLPLEAEIRGRRIVFFTRPSLGGVELDLAAARLLGEWAAVAADARVLHMHCGSGLAGAAVAARLGSGRLTMLDCHVAAVRAAQRTLEANGITQAEVVLSDCAQAVQGQVFDSVLALMPKSRAVWEQTILDAANVLREGGDFYLAGSNNQGIKSAARFMESVFGPVYVLAYKGGSRVLRAVKGPGTQVPASDYYLWRTIQVEVGGESLAYVTRPGLFSWAELDDGTRLLIETLQAHGLRADDRVLDLGSGSGVLSLVAARQAPGGHVVAVDADCRAVEATRRTLAHNRIENAEVLLSDITEALGERAFSALVTNPPFHREQATNYVIGGQIIREAARHLERRGRLYLVANAFLRYEPLLLETFGNAEVLSANSRFKVWHAIQWH